MVGGTMFFGRMNLTVVPPYAGAAVVSAIKR